MSQADGKGQQSQLSAEANSFIPTKYNSPVKMQSPSQEAPGGGPPAGRELPKYMTSCYPFVKGDPGPRPARWPSPGRSSQQSLHVQRAQQGNYNYSGPRPPVGYNYPGNFPPRQAFSPSPTPIVPYGPNIEGNSPIPGQVPYPYYTPYPAIVPSPASPQGWTSPLGMYQDVQYGSAYASGQYYAHSEAGESCHSWSGSEKGRGQKFGKKQKKKTEPPPGPSMVSVGVQNESGLQSKGVKKPRTKTIILMDAAIQTDFSDEIANLTLAEKPNSLFKKSKVRNRRKSQANRPGTTSTDSEEIDSDSGYSSPLHRRNQISSGTHPVVSGGFTGQNGHIPHSQVNSVYVLPNSAPLASTTHFCDAERASVSSCEPLNSSLSSINHTVYNTQTSGPELLENNTGKKKRRRNRRRKRKNAKGDGTLSDVPGGLDGSSNVSKASSEQLDLGEETGLHFEDEEEFPDLSGANSPSAKSNQQVAPVMSYSQILQTARQTPSKTQTPEESPEKDNQSDQFKASPPGLKEGKNARKRRKRCEMANKAAEVELAEITIEQQMLKEIGLKKQQQQAASGKKSKQPLTLNIADMIDALEKQQEKDKKKQEKREQQQGGVTKPKEPPKVGPVTPHNILDSTAPGVKRGKEKECPKSKKPSPLKKVILKEREERKRNRLLDVGEPVSTSCSMVSLGMGVDSDLSQDAASFKASSVDTSMDIDTPASADLSPISQNSPISMSPLSPGGSPLSSGVNSPIAGTDTVRVSSAKVSSKIHSRRFREYCNQILDKEIDDCCTLLLQDLVRFQDRLYHKDPIKAKSKRRIVLGLREVTKHLKLKKIRLVIISPNLERIQSKGGLDDALNNIIAICQEHGLPFVFALGRRALGRACAKLVPVSVVGVFNFEGAEHHFQQLMSLTEKARQAYQEMVSILEKEIKENPGHASSNLPQLYAHMGHSRTPSACSAISFASSILSEPISENYPHSEPETDSKGYELAHKTHPVSGLVTADLDNANNNPDKVTIIESIHEIDEGHEADTEDGPEKEKEMSPVPDSPTDSDGSVHIKDCGDNEGAQKESLVEEKLGHIDSIHNTTPVIPNTQGEPTTSVKAENVAASTVSQPKCDGIPVKADIIEVSLGDSQKLKMINKDRIETWVVEAQNCMQQLDLEDVSDSEMGTGKNVAKMKATDKG